MGSCNITKNSFSYLYLSALTLKLTIHARIDGSINTMYDCSRTKRREGILTLELIAEGNCLEAKFKSFKRKLHTTKVEKIYQSCSICCTWILYLYSACNNTSRLMFIILAEKDVQFLDISIDTWWLYIIYEDWALCCLEFIQ